MAQMCCIGKGVCMRKKLLCFACVIFILISSMLIQVSAEDESMSFLFSLTVDGRDTAEVKTGDIITVVFQLDRTDANEQYMMYAMQNEIRYDSTFFELVDNSVILNHGVVSNDISMVDQYREFYMNYLSMRGGEMWNPSIIIGSIQLKVIAESGVTCVTNQDYLVSCQDGADSYQCSAKDLTVILSTECKVEFDSNGGTDLPDQVVRYGEKLDIPEDPTREGYVLDGWYQDIHLTQKWDFENDVVRGNMRLYAKWVADTSGGITEERNQGEYWIWILLILYLLILLLLYLLLKMAKRERKRRKRRTSK